MQGDTEGVKPAFMRYMELVRPLVAEEEALYCVFPGWATTKSKENESVVGRSVRVNVWTVARELLGAISF